MKWEGGCGGKLCTQDDASKVFEQDVMSLQVNDVRAEQLKWSMLGEITNEGKVGIKYRANETTGQEAIELPTEWPVTYENIMLKEGVKELVYQTAAYNRLS